MQTTIDLSCTVLCWSKNKHVIIALINSILLRHLINNRIIFLHNLNPVMHRGFNYFTGSSTPPRLFVNSSIGNHYLKIGQLTGAVPKASEWLFIQGSLKLWSEEKKTEFFGNGFHIFVKRKTQTQSLHHINIIPDIKHGNSSIVLPFDLFLCTEKGKGGIRKIQSNVGHKLFF